MTSLRWAAPEHHESIGSTNVEALLDPRTGRVLVADHQSAGQGRQGRVWESPPGAGMAISVVVPSVPVELMGWLPMAAGLALARALQDSRWTVTAGLKWPNDVLVPLREDTGERAAPEQGQKPEQEPVLEAEGRRWGKVAGTLAQVTTGLAGRVVVIGTGVNIDHTLTQLPVPTATSWRLARGGAALPEGAREGLLSAYLEALAHAHDQLAAGDHQRVRTDYLDRCLTLGRGVTVHLPGGATVLGTATGIDESGALVVEGPGGRSIHHAGDIEHARPGRPDPR